IGEPTSASDDLATEELTKRGAENQLPPLPLRQLLRSRFDSLEKPAHLGQNFRDLRGLRVRARDLHRGLISVPGLPGDGVQCQWSRSDGFGVFLRNSQAHEDRPPVVDQGDDPPHDLAALPVLCREACPPPLVLQLVEVVLRIAPVPVVLRHGPHLVRQRGHQHCVLILHSLVSQFRVINHWRCKPKSLPGSISPFTTSNSSTWGQPTSSRPRGSFRSQNRSSPSCSHNSQPNQQLPYGRARRNCISLSWTSIVSTAPAGAGRSSENRLYCAARNRRGAVRQRRCRFGQPG